MCDAENSDNPSKCIKNVNEKKKTRDNKEWTKQIIIVVNKITVQFQNRRSEDSLFWFLGEMILLPAPPIISFPANPTLPLSSPPYWPRRIDNSAVVSAASREVDSFTSKSGYLFNLSADEADSLSEYNFPRIDAMYKKKPLILLRRLAQIGTTFGFWFGLRLADEALDRSEQMFKVC